MVSRTKDISGMTFSYWTVVARAGYKRNGAAWLCRCECGTEKIMQGSRLILGESKSCGCRPKQIASHGHTTNYSRSATYQSWQSMVSRCTQPSNPAFVHYQKRGITICEGWRKFDNFFQDMGERPEGTTLDRIDNNGNYEPGNCRWATKQQQANNRFTNKRFELYGVGYTIAELSEKFGIPRDVLRGRLVKARTPWPIEEAVLPAKMRGRRRDREHK